MLLKITILKLNDFKNQFALLKLKKYVFTSNDRAYINNTREFEGGNQNSNLNVSIAILFLNLYLRAATIPALDG